MANIKTLLENIKNAKWVGNMIDSVHDAIKQVYDDAATNGNANMEVTLARGTENTLNDRLTKMDEVDQTTTAELATLDQQKANNDEVRKKSVKLKPEDFSEETLELVTGTGTVNLTTIPQDESVTVYKTTFIETSQNLFNKDDVLMGQYYSYQGTLTTNSTYNSPKPFRVESGETYVTELPNYLHVAFWDKDGNAITGIQAGQWSGIITIPSNVVLLAFAIPATVDLEKLMFVKGNVYPTTYIEFKHKLESHIDLSDEQKDKLVSSEDMEITVGKNIFDKTKVKEGYEVYADGSIRVNASSVITEEIDVNGVSAIYISGFPTYSNGLAERQGYFYDELNNPIGTMFTINKSATDKQLTVPDGASYLIASIYQRKTSSEVFNYNTIQIEEGTIKTEYEPYTLFINKLKGYEFKSSNPSVDNELKTKGKALLGFGDSIMETATVSDDGATYTEGTRSNWLTFSKTSLKLGQLWNYAKSGARFRDIADGVTELLPRQKLSHQITTAIANNRPADIIVVAASTNDISDGASYLGNYDTAMSKTSLDSLDRTLFYEAVRWAFWTLRLNYPNAVCYAATPIQRNSIEIPSGFREALIKMANRYNFIIIDQQYESGIVRELSSTYLSDGLHPNVAGQKKMSKLADRVILNTYNPVE